MKPVTVNMLALCVVALATAIGCSTDTDNSKAAGRHTPQLTQQEIRDRFAEVVKRISEPLITAPRETVTGLQIGDRDDPEDGPITVRIAAVHTLGCGCCDSNVQDTKFFDEDLALVLSVYNIGHLTVNRTRITDNGLKKLVDHPNLTNLDLSHNDLTDAAFVHIGQLRHLKVLNLNNTPVTGFGLQHLAELKELEEIHLSGTLLKDSALRYLSPLTNLKKLVLTGTPLDGHGFAKVSGLDHLEEIQLAGAKCSDEGLSQLPAFQSLRQIDLAGTKSGDATLMALSSNLNLENIKLSQTNITDMGLAHLSRLRQLKSLRLSRTAITDDGLAHLASVTTLEILEFAETNIRGRGICYLRGCLNLRFLGSAYGRRHAIEADEDTLATLARFKQLTQLNIRLVANESSPPVVDFHEMDNLGNVKITCCETVDSIQLSGMPKLWRLSIRYPGQPSRLSDISTEQEPVTVPQIGRIVLSDLGSNNPARPLRLSIVVPDELRLRNINRVNQLWITGSIQPRHAAEFATLPPPYSAEVVCTADSKPDAVIQILSNSNEEQPRNLELAIGHWNKAWSDAMRTVRSPLRQLTLRLRKVDDNAPIPLEGFENLSFLALSGLTADHVTLENVSPKARELRLGDVCLGELRLLECCVPVSCFKVRQLERLVIDGIPQGKKYVSVFYSRSHVKDSVNAPNILELRNIRDMYLCNLRHGQGLKRVEIFGDCTSFAAFKFVPSTVKEMTWDDREPGAWQGGFEHRQH